MQRELSEEATVYLAPNIRSQSIETLRTRTETRQQRRLLLAIETHQLQQIKTEGMVKKDAEKFTKLIASASKRLDAARDAMNKAEDEVNAATGLHNSMTLLQGTLK